MPQWWKRTGIDRLESVPTQIQKTHLTSKNVRVKFRSGCLWPCNLSDALEYPRLYSITQFSYIYNSNLTIPIFWIVQSNNVTGCCLGGRTKKTDLHQNVCQNSQLQPCQLNVSTESPCTLLALFEQHKWQEDKWICPHFSFETEKKKKHTEV